MFGRPKPRDLADLPTATLTIIIIIITNPDGASISLCVVARDHEIALHTS